VRRMALMILTDARRWDYKHQVLSTRHLPPWRVLSAMDVRNERIALDIDEPKDLRAAAGRVSPQSATARLINQLQFRATD